MKKTKAAFKALREECGLTQSDVAAEADVDVRSVKRWENPDIDGYEPPDDVWMFLLNCREGMYLDAAELAGSIVQSLNSVDGAHDLQLDYYRKQEDLDAVQLAAGIDEPVGYYNARMRAIGRLLEAGGIPYTYRYPEQ